MDPSRSDNGVTSPVTSGHSTTKKQYQRRKRTAKPKAVNVTPLLPSTTRKLKPYQLKETISQSSEVQSSTIMPLSLFKRLLTPKEPPSTSKSTSLEDLTTTMINIVEEKEP